MIIHYLLLYTICILVAYLGDPLLFLLIGQLGVVQYFVGQRLELLYQILNLSSVVDVVQGEPGLASITRYYLLSKIIQILQHIDIALRIIPGYICGQARDLLGVQRGLGPAFELVGQGLFEHLST